GRPHEARSSYNMARAAVGGWVCDRTLGAAGPLDHGMDTRVVSDHRDRRYGHDMEGQLDHGGRYWRLAAHLARSAAVAPGLRRRTAVGIQPPLVARAIDLGAFMAGPAHVGSVVAIAG